MNKAKLLLGLIAVASVAAVAVVGTRTSVARGIEDLAPPKNITDLYRDVDLTKPHARCGRVFYFDFGSPHDGPAYYTDHEGNILARCGGLLRGRLAADVDKSMYICPAEQWSCAAPDVGAILKKRQQNSETNRQ